MHTVCYNGDIRVPPTVSYMHYLSTVSTLTAAVPFHLPAPQSAELSPGFHPGPEHRSVSDICLKRVCSLDTSAFIALEVLNDYCAV